MEYKRCNCKESCQHEHRHVHGHHHEHGHGHGHEHRHDGGNLRKHIGLLALSTLLLVAAVAVEKTSAPLPTWQLLLVYLVPYLMAGRNTLCEAAEGIVHGDFFNENFLMTVATIGALCIGFLPGAETEFTEAVAVMLFFQVGEMFETYAEGRSRQGIASLMDIRPDVAHVLKGEWSGGGERDNVEDASPEAVVVGSILLVRPGEKMPLDGVVVKGSSSLSTVALTGESMPRDVGVGDDVVSGCVNMTGVLYVRTTKEYGESTVAKIISLVESASERKSRSEAFITRFARIYTPVVVAAAIALAVLPPLFISLTAQHVSFMAQFTVWLHRALIFLVVSCPCALVISVPLTFFGGIGGAARSGILVKGANFMDVLAKTDTVVFDKTGTLTKGLFSVKAIHTIPFFAHSDGEGEEKHLLHLAAHVEHYSTHPIGAALREAFPDEVSDGCTVSEVQEVAGHGIRAKVCLATTGQQETFDVCVGNEKMMTAIGAQIHSCENDTGTIIHVAIDGSYAGHIIVGDTVKDDSATAIEQLRQMGMKRMVMLTGDRDDVAAHVAATIGIEDYYAAMLPADKSNFIDGIKDSTVAFVGDGINDAPVLARADVGIAMGALGSDAAIEAADVVIMDDSPAKVATAIALARRTTGIAMQNVAMAIGVKALVLTMATAGLATMWMAVFADVGVTVLAVLNAMRALKGGKLHKLHSLC